MGKACSCETLDIEIEAEPKPQREEITDEKYTNEIQEKLQFVEKVIASGELFTDSEFPAQVSSIYDMEVGQERVNEFERNLFEQEV